MPTIGTDGLILPRTAAEIKQLLIDAAIVEFGPGVTNPANTIHQAIDAFMTLPMDAIEQEFITFFAEFDPRTNTGLNLENSLWPLFTRLQASISSGKVQINWKSPFPTTPTPLFATGEVDFFDGGSRKFRLNANVDPPSKVFDSDATGTASEVIGATNVKIAQKFVLTADSFVQGIRFKPTQTAGALTLTVSIQEDSAGSPTGSPFHARLERTAFLPVSGVFQDLVFTKGAMLPEGIYHVVIQPTASGEGTFDGGATGTINQVKTFTGGSWVNSGLVENLNLEVIKGGEANVVSVSFGTEQNISAGSISGHREANAVAVARFSSLVSSFENLAAFEGGRLKETDVQVRARVRSARAARETASLDGIILSVFPGTAGVTSADGIENTTLDWADGDSILDNSAFTAQSSESIDGTPERLSQRFVTTEYRSVSSIAYNLSANNAFVAGVRIETDVAGVPSGTLVSNKFVGTASPSGTGRKTFTFDEGDFLPAGTYHIVFTRTSGDATFAGTSGGATNNVNIYPSGGPYAASASVEDAAVEVYGGLPPKSFRIWAKDGNEDDIAQSIHVNKPAGIYADGSETGIAKDIGDRPVTVRFERPLETDIVATVTADVDATFGGTADTLRDLLVEYIGIDTDNGVESGVGISKDIVYNEALARLVHGDDRTQGVKVTTFRIGRKADFPTPGNLTATEVVDIVAARGELLQIANAGNDIAVALVSV